MTQTGSPDSRIDLVLAAHSARSAHRPLNVSSHEQARVRRSPFRRRLGVTDREGLSTLAHPRAGTGGTFTLKIFRCGNPRLLPAVVVVPTFMEVLDNRGRVKHVNKCMTQIGDHIGRTGVISGQRPCQSTKP
jgi:hypothetical protein